MSLEAGTQLGPYKIVSRIGAGGMGEVYKADDPRLGRSVAIKVLPQHMAENPALRQRLEREARAVSSLSHPNICALYDVGHQNGLDFLVMEFLEGETLGERVERGAMPNEELFACALQIADGLDKAHRAGIVHRDLKPSNIMLTKDGAKLLDFGLAKADSPMSGQSATSLTASPTMSTPLTAEGTILGTYQYMSPEQLEGKEADVRSDLFALGCVLYEMATGKRAFAGPSQASVIGAIMHAQPDPVSQVQPLAPPALDRVIQSCLAKDPDERWQTAHDVLLQLRWIAEGGSVVGVPAQVSSQRRHRERLAWGLFAAAVIAAGVLAVGFVARAPQPMEPVQFQVVPAPEIATMGSPRISPDGRQLAFNATGADGASMLWVRSLDALEARPLPGTEGTGRPFWSPDSRQLAFFAGGKLKKVGIFGAPPQTICDAVGADGTWGAEGVILYDNTSADPIRSVPASGGVPKELLASDSAKGENSVGWPEFLPDGQHFLFMAMRAGENALLVGSTEPGFEPIELFTVSSRVAFAPPGHLLYVRDDTLVAQSFDADELELTGEPIPLAEELGITGAGLAHFGASANGVLVYRAGETGLTRLVWVDRSGRELEEVGQPAEHRSTALSPDGKKLMLTINDPANGNGDLWIRDLERGVNSRFTFDAAPDFNPLFTPDGRYVLFNSNRNDTSGIYRKATSGAGQPELLYASDALRAPASFTPDGRHVALTGPGKDTSWDLWVLSLEEGNDPEVTPYVQTPFFEVRPQFSPDGKWIAYDSLESGRMEVYVQSFPGSGGKWQISTNGGSEPVWSPDGSELYYIGANMAMMRVPIETGDTLTLGLPEAMFDSMAYPTITRNRYLVSGDGERFLMLRSMRRDTVFPTTVVLNWPATLRQ